MNRIRLSLLVATGLVLAIACKTPQTSLVEVSYDARQGKVTIPNGECRGGGGDSQVDSSGRHVKLDLAVGQSIGVTVNAIPSGHFVRYSKHDLTEEAVPMPAPWTSMFGSPTTTTATKTVAEQTPEAPTLPDILTRVQALVSTDEASPTPGKAPTPAEAGKPIPAPAQQANRAVKRILGSLLRDAKQLHEAFHSHEAYEKVLMAEGLLETLPADEANLKAILEKDVKKWKECILGTAQPQGDLQPKDLLHRDRANLALRETAQRLSLGTPAEALTQLDIAEAEARLLPEGPTREGLLKRARTMREALQGISNSAALPFFTYSNKDFEIRVEVVPAGSPAPELGGTTPLAQGFFLRAQRGRDWILFPSTGFALSSLVDRNYGVTPSKTIVDQGGDTARAEALVMMNFQPKTTTNARIPWLMGLGVGTTGGDIRYYFSPLGASLGRWGAIHLGCVGGKVMRLKEDIQRGDGMYTGANPNEDRHSVFRFGAFFSLSARFSN